MIVKSSLFYMHMQKTCPLLRAGKAETKLSMVDINNQK